MTFHQIEYFLAVSKYLNFSQAANESYISQSTLSNQIKKLEEEFGVSLFVRGSRYVRLTPAGEDFLQYARRISSEITLSKDKMQEYTSYHKGHIRIGFAPAMAYFDIQNIVLEFLSEFNNMEARFYSGRSDSLLKGMREKKSMLAFVTAPFANEYDVDFYPLYEERTVLLVSKSNPLSNETAIDLADISNERFLTSGVIQHHLDDLYGICGINPKIVLDSDDIHLLKCMAEEDLGVTMLGERVANTIAGTRCAVVPLKQNLVRSHGLAIPKTKRLPLSTKAFRDFVLARFSVAWADNKADDQ